MIIHPDGTFTVNEGEYMPFCCPKCNTVIPYDDKVFMVHCPGCGYIGDKTEFSPEFFMKPDNPQKGI